MTDIVSGGYEIWRIFFLRMDKNICIIGHKGYISSCLCALDELEVDSMFDVDIKCGGMIAVDL